MDPELERYKLKVSLEKLHDLLYYATLYVGDGATTAVECAVLGTPSIYVSSLVGTMGNFMELEDKYSLIFNCNDSNLALKKAYELLQYSNIKNIWALKKELLKDKINVTEFMIRFVENL